MAQTEFDQGPEGSTGVRQKAAVLSQVFDLAKVDSTGWSEEDLSEVLNHLLSAPISLELAHFRSPSGEVSGLAGAVFQNEGSFRDLLLNTKPELNTLKLVKEYAKACIRQRESPLPESIGWVLYYVSVVVARLRLGERISASDDPSIRSGILWVLKQPWLDRELRGVVQSGLELFLPS